MGRPRQLPTAALAVFLAGSALLSGQRTVREQTIFVSVTDRQGAPAPSLELTDLSIREDGASREVLKVERATGAMHIAVLVDTSEAARAAIPDLRSSVREFAAAIWAASPESRIALMGFGGRPTVLAEYSNSAVTFGRALDRLFTDSDSGAYFLDATMEAAAAMAKGKAERAAIVAYVDETGPEFSNRRRDQVFDSVAAARASLWTITRQGGAEASATAEGRERSLVIGDVTTRTGGQSALIFAPSAIKTRLLDVSRHLLGQFAVTYGRPESLIPPDRLEVRLSKDGFRLLAPRWTNK